LSTFLVKYQILEAKYPFRTEIDVDFR